MTNPLFTPPEETEEIGSALARLIRSQLERSGFGDALNEILTWVILCAFILILASLAYFIARVIVTRSVRYVAKRSTTHWDDILVEHRVFARLSYIAPALVVFLFASAFPEGPRNWIQRFAHAYMIFMAVLVANALINAGMGIYYTTQFSRTRPIKGFVQVLKILLYIVGAILIIAKLMNQPAWGLLSGLGAMTAVLLIVFKDTLLGLVASFQITSADMVREGDWIEMPKYGADGDVIDVSLHAVKVKNWDKTITTIPTYALVSDSFKNWRGMTESGGRRIKRSIPVDMNSVRFCTDEELDRYEKVHFVSDYVKRRRKEVAEFNETQGFDIAEPINGRRLTNLGTFRAYVVGYLRNHAKIHQDMTFLVRHLQPTENGLHLQVYVFSRIQAWAEYESIQADILDHLLAVLQEFELRIFQRGSDLGYLRQTG